MFENIITSTTTFLNTCIEYIKNTTMHLFYSELGLSMENIRFISLMLILTTFTFLTVMTFLIYLKSMTNFVKGKNSEQLNLPPQEVVLKIGYSQAENKKETFTKPTHGYNAGIVLDMLSRGVTEFKSSQAMMMKTKGAQTQESILQMVTSLKDFVGLCKNGVFKNILPQDGVDEKKSLEDIIRGDITSTLELLFLLIEKEVKRAEKLENKKKKDSIFKRLSDTMCIFGNIAALKDFNLARKSFETAIELNPQNIKAWSRTADMYYEASFFDKAEERYKNIIEFADKQTDKQQIANANIMLSKYYYMQENVLEAQKLYNLGHPYYEELGIGTDLNEREKDVLGFIEETLETNIEKTVSKLLENQVA